jgi:hypothetical protein
MYDMKLLYIYIEAMKKQEEEKRHLGIITKVIMMRHENWGERIFPSSFVSIFCFLLYVASASSSSCVSLFLKNIFHIFVIIFFKSELFCSFLGRLICLFFLPFWGSRTKIN